MKKIFLFIVMFLFIFPNIVKADSNVDINKKFYSIEMGKLEVLIIRTSNITSGKVYFESSDTSIVELSKTEADIDGNAIRVMLLSRGIGDATIKVRFENAYDKDDKLISYQKEILAKVWTSSNSVEVDDPGHEVSDGITINKESIGYSSTINDYTVDILDDDTSIYLVAAGDIVTSIEGTYTINDSKELKVDIYKDNNLIQTITIHFNRINSLVKLTTTKKVKTTKTTKSDNNNWDKISGYIIDIAIVGGIVGIFSFILVRTYKKYI